MFKILAAGLSALTLMAGAASAATVTLTSGISQTIASVPGQDFKPKLTAAGATHLFSGPLSMVLSGPARLTFSLVAAESGFNNALHLDGTPVITERYRNSSVADFATGLLGGEVYSAVFAGGDIGPRLGFDINGDGSVEFDAGDDEFGVFADISQVAALDVFYLGLDDSGSNNDDNHDDLIVRVDIAPVPLPAAGWLLFAGFGGLAGLSRMRRKA